MGARPRLVRPLPQSCGRVRSGSTTRSRKISLLSGSTLMDQVPRLTLSMSVQSRQLASLGMLPATKVSPSPASRPFPSSPCDNRRARSKVCHSNIVGIMDFQSTSNIPLFIAGFSSSRITATRNIRALHINRALSFIALIVPGMVVTLAMVTQEKSSDRNISISSRPPGRGGRGTLT